MRGEIFQLFQLDGEYQKMNLNPLLRSVSEQDLHILNMVVRQGGDIVAEHDFAEEKRVLLWSVSKTFTSMAVGIAAHEGYFKIKDRLAEYFQIPSDPLWSEVTIHDLLGMGTGQRKCAFTQALNSGTPLDNIEELFFEETVVFTPGTHFLYNNTATYMLSKLISKTTNCCLNDYLRPRVFEPLGIHNVQWEQDVHGINFGCSGLHLSAHELSRFGQLLLDRGTWQGKSLIPGDYILAATSKQIDTADFDEYFATADHRSGYGYQVWMNSYPGSYRLDGLYGQYVVVIPEKKAVITYVSNEPTKMTTILELTWQFIVDQL